MNKLKLVSILSCATLTVVALSSCNQGHGSRDVASYHLLGDNQKLCIGIGDGSDPWKSFDYMSKQIKKLNEQIAMYEKMPGYEAKVKQLKQKLNETKENYKNIVGTFSIKNLITCEPTSGSTVEYGKDLELDIYPKSEFVLLANAGIDSKKTDEYNIMHNPYASDTTYGYAVPYVGYGNALKPHAAKLAEDQYSYKQDSTNKQKFHLHIDGDAFKKNIVIDFGMGLDDVTNCVSIISSSYLLKDGDDNSRVSMSGDKVDYFQMYSDGLTNATPFNVADGGETLSEGMQFTYSLNSFVYNQEEVKDTNIPGTQNDLYTLKGFENGKDFKIVGSFEESKKKDPVTISNVKYAINTYTNTLTVTVPWEEIHNLNEGELKYERKFDYLTISFDNEPKHETEITVTANKDSGATVIEKGYGHREGYALGTGANTTSVGNNYFDLDNYNNFCNNGKGMDNRKYYRFRTTIEQDQGGSSNIVWPNIEIVKTADNGTVITDRFITDDATKTGWREDIVKTEISKDEIWKNTKETELNYIISEYKGFVMICLNPVGRTIVDGYHDDVKGEDVDIAPQKAEKHNMFLIYDIYEEPTKLKPEPKYSVDPYYFYEEGAYFKTVDINILKQGA